MRTSLLEENQIFSNRNMNQDNYIIDRSRLCRCGNPITGFLELHMRWEELVMKFEKRLSEMGVPEDKKELFELPYNDYFYGDPDGFMDCFDCIINPVLPPIFNGFMNIESTDYHIEFGRLKRKITDYFASIDYNVDPKVFSRLPKEHQDMFIQIKKEHDEYMRDNYKNSENSKHSIDPHENFRWGGLTGQEAYDGYWNTD
jgi:hypothetical protein